MPLPIPVLTCAAGEAFQLGKKMVVGKDENAAHFAQLLESSTGPNRNLLGVKRMPGNASALQTASRGKMSQEDLKSILASLRKGILEKNEPRAKLVLDHPDERLLTEFLKNCGFKETEIAQIKREMATGAEGQYDLNIIFALLGKHTGPAETNDSIRECLENQTNQAIDSVKLGGTDKTSTFTSKLPSEITPLATQKPLSPDDLAGVQGMLNELGLPPAVVSRLSEQLSSKSGVKIRELVEALKKLGDTPLKGVPLEEHHRVLLTNWLKKLGVNEQDVRRVMNEAGMSDSQLSLPKLTALFEGASEELSKNNGPVDKPKLLDHLERLLSTAKIKTDSRSDSSADLGLLRTWEGKWVEKLRGELGNPGTKSLADQIKVPTEVSVEGENLIPKLSGPTDYLPKPGENSALLIGSRPVTLPELMSNVAEKPVLSNIVRPETVYPQILDGMFRWLRLKEDKVVIKLSPPELGEMKIDLAMKNGQLNATFLIDDRRVKEIVESSLPQLRTALSEQGIQMGECNVELNQNFRQFFGNSEQYTHNPAWRLSENSLGTNTWPEAELESTFNRGSPDRGIDLFA